MPTRASAYWVGPCSVPAPNIGSVWTSRAATTTRVSSTAPGVSITIGLTVTIFATAIALIGGSISGYYGGIVILTLFGDRGVPQVSLVLIILG